MITRSYANRGSPEKDNPMGSFNLIFTLCSDLGIMDIDKSKEEYYETIIRFKLFYK